MEEKNYEFTRWVDGQLQDATGEALKSEWRVIRSLCDSETWYLNIKTRDMGHATVIHAQKGLDNKIMTPILLQYTATTQAIRKMREMGVLQ